MRRYLLAFALFAASGCRRDEITHFRVRKAPEATLARGAMPASADLPPPPTPDGSGALQWNLPKGWTESAAGGMRYATLKVPVQGRVDVSVVVLPGPAGGELANVNRWRGQLGLAPVDEKALAAARKELRSKAGMVSVYDFTSEGEKKSRLVAGLAVAGGNTWFLKMLGDAGPVAAARPEFIHLLQSLHFDDAR